MFLELTQLYFPLPPAIDTKTPGGRVYRSEPVEGTKPDATLTIEDDDYVALLFGKLNPQRAFMKGMIKVKGNIMLLQRLDTLWNQIQRTRRDPELPFVKEILLNTVSLVRSGMQGPGPSDTSDSNSSIVYLYRPIQ